MGFTLDSKSVVFHIPQWFVHDKHSGTAEVNPDIDGGGGAFERAGEFAHVSIFLFVFIRNIGLQGVFSLFFNTSLSSVFSG